MTPGLTLMRCRSWTYNLERVADAHTRRSCLIVAWGSHPRPLHFFHNRVRHQVKYADGESDSLLLAVERVRLLMVPGQPLPAPSPARLQTLADVLRAHADRLDAVDSSAHPASTASADEDAEGVQQLHQPSPAARWLQCLYRVHCSSKTPRPGSICSLLHVTVTFS